MDMLNEKSFQRLNEDMDYTAMIDTIYKIKATLQIIVGKDKSLVKKIKKKYIEMKKIDMSSSDEGEK